MEDTSLRDTIAANLAAVNETPEKEPAAPSQEVAEAVAMPSPAQDDPAKDDARPRNPDGTFAPKAQEAPPQAKTEAAPAPVQEQAAPLAPAPKMPSSWKKEMAAHWEKLPREVQEEAIRRESDYSRGVSQHRQAYERVKALDEAVSPYREIMRQNGMDEAQAIKKLLDVQYALTMGAPQQRMELINGIIADYQLPVRLAAQNAQGEWQLIDAAQRAAPQPQQPQQRQPDPRDIVREELQRHEITRQLSDFVNAKDASGNPLHPHYEAVKDDMALILESGRAEDLQGAYDKAIRLHDDIWQAHQRASAEADAARKAADAKAKVARARSSAVSVVSSPPSGTMGSNEDKSLSEQLRDNLRAVAGGRV